MIKEVIFLQVLGNYRGAIGNTLSRWEQMGFFDYLLPFLLIFALIFGILTKIKIFEEENKSVKAIIALSVGLMALQFNFVSIFFSEIFPRLGVGLAIVLIILILVGMFSDPESGAIMWTMFGIGVIIVIVILVQTAGSLGWSSGYFISQNWMDFAVLIVFLILFAIAVSAGSPKTARNFMSPYAQMLRGGGGPHAG